MDTSDNTMSEWIATTLIAALMVVYPEASEIQHHRMAQVEIDKIVGQLAPDAPAWTLMRPTILRAAEIVNGLAN